MSFSGNVHISPLDISIRFPYNDKLRNGAVAQLGERCVRNAQVGGSNPLCSIYCLVECNTQGLLHIEISCRVGK